MGRNSRTDGPQFAQNDTYPIIFETPGPYEARTFDDRGWPVTVTRPNGTGDPIITSYSYAGLETTITDPDGRDKVEKKDILGRLVEVRELGTITTQYAYNAAGDLISVTDSAGNITAMGYNTLGLKTSMVDPDMGSWTYVYDQYGNLLTQTDAKSQTVTCSYDALNRKISKTFSTGDPAVTYVYDLPGENRIGRLASAVRGGHVTSYGYDAMGRTARETRTVDGVDYVTLFTYDLSGKPASVSYPEGSGTVSYEYHDGSGLVHYVREGQTVHAALSDYTPTGQIGHISYANGVSTSYAYDSESRRLTGITTVSGGNTLQSFLYGYTEGGDIAGVTRDGVVYSYTYDDLHRLIGESSVNGSIAYTYNNIGNMTQKVVFGNTLDYSYNDVAHKHAVSGIVLNGGSSMPFTYDANGNLVAGPDLTDLQNIESRAITWNAENMPAQIVHSGLGTCGFEYDGLGQRSKKVIAGGSVSRYIGRYYEKVDLTGTRYVFAGNMRIAKVTGAQIHYYHQDHLGSSTVMTDTNGVVQETTAYLPYGSMRTHAGLDISNHKFTGQELDPETGLYYFNARYYDSAIGRFISADPVVPDFANPQSLNRYTYCLNNPLIYIDPSGYWTQEGEVLAISGYFAELEGIEVDIIDVGFTDIGLGKLIFDIKIELISIWGKIAGKGDKEELGTQEQREFRDYIKEKAKNSDYYLVQREADKAICWELGMWTAIDKLQYTHRIPTNLKNAVTKSLKVNEDVSAFGKAAGEAISNTYSLNPCHPCNEIANLPVVDDDKQEEDD